MKAASSILILLVVFATATRVAPAQPLGEQDEEPIWTSQPTRIDRAKQSYERIPGKKVERDTRLFLVVPQRIKVLDSTSFLAGETTYRIAHVRPVKAKRLCQAIEGGRWACGRMASIFLGNLVRGKRLLCESTEIVKTRVEATPVETAATAAAPAGKAESIKVTMLDNCAIGTRNVAEAIVSQGYGMGEQGEALLAVQAAAQKLAATGLWRNAKCVADFDNC